MSSETLLKPGDESGYVIAWRAKYQFETGRLDGEMPYAEAVKECERLHAEEPGKTFWPQKAAESYGKFHKDHG